MNQPLRFIVAIVSVAFLGGVAAAQAPPPRQFAREIVLVDLRVGDIPGWALVDTGSSYTYVDNDLREALCGPPDPSTKAPPPKFAATTLWIGGRLTVKQKVRFLDLQPFNDSAAKRPLIAIIGRDLLGAYAIGVDVKRGRMRLWKGGNVDEPTIRRFALGKERGGMSVDVHVAKPARSWNGGIVRLSLDVAPESGAWRLNCAAGDGGPRFHLNFDTGSSFTSIEWKKLAGLSLKPLRTETVADLLGPMAHRVVLLPKLTVAGFDVTDVEVFVEEEDVRPDILAPKDLGVSWSVIDPPAGKLYVPGAG